MKFINKIKNKLIYNISLLFSISKPNPNINRMAGHLTINPKKEKSKIPKIIWLYWEGEESQTVNICIKKIEKQHQDYQINKIDRENLKEYIETDYITDKFNNLTPQQRSDIIRLTILYKHGGIWIDASTIINERIDWIIKLIENDRTESFGYYRLHNTTKIDSPVIESWLLVSKKENIFFKTWLEELQTALKIGAAHYIRQIKSKHKNHQEIFQKIGRLEYLTIYVACQVVMQKEKPSISLINCDENALLYQTRSNWSKYAFLTNLCINNSNTPPVIKATGKERRELDKAIREKKYLNNSIIGNLLDEQKNI